MSRSRPEGRVVFHVDMDAFFASVEALDDPGLRGRPVIVGASPERHGVVASASYEAREFGVRSAMPVAKALRLCPRAVRLDPRHERYAEVSGEVFEILGRFTPVVEPVSIDEAYMDLTGCVRDFAEAERSARRLKKTIRKETRLTASVGVAANKLLAKVASDLDKPDGLLVVTPGSEAAVLAPLSVEKLPGIGPKTAAQLERLGMGTIGELAACPTDRLARRFGPGAAERLTSFASALQARARGEDASLVGLAGETKSVSAERTLRDFTSDRAVIDRVLLELAEDVAGRARGEKLWGRTVTLKLRDDRFSTTTRSKTLPRPTDLAIEVARVARELFRAKPLGRGRRVRLLGVALSRLEETGSGQAELLPDESRERARRLERVVDDIRRRHGGGAVRRGSILKKKGGKRPGAGGRDAGRAG